MTPEETKEMELEIDIVMAKAGPFLSGPIARNALRMAWLMGHRKALEWSKEKLKDLSKSMGI